MDKIIYKKRCYICKAEMPDGSTNDDLYMHLATKHTRKQIISALMDMWWMAEFDVRHADFEAVRVK